MLNAHTKFHNKKTNFGRVRMI